jgi:integrase
MARRSGQSGYIEQKGNAFYVRFWIDVAGHEKRAHKSVRICPVSGPGKLNKPERERRAKQIIAESGADSEEHFNRVEAINSSVTFKQQAEWFLKHVQKRKRRPVKPKTVSTWNDCHRKWLVPFLGQMPLHDVDNLAAKNFVAHLSEAGLSANTIRNYVNLMKLVIGSAINERGEQIHPRKWNHDFIDMPEIKNQNTPCFTAEQVTAMLKASSGWHQVLCALLAGTGLRIGEALGLEIGKHISEDCRVITIKQSVWYGTVQDPKTLNAVREVDVAPALAAFLRKFIGGRTSGFLFKGSRGRAKVSQSSILKRHLHPLLRVIGCKQSGFHAFRRFRVTYLRRNRVPENVLQYWIGHANKTVTDGYDKVKEDAEFRRMCAEAAGFGFEIPAELTPAKSAAEPSFVPICTQNVEVGQAA